MTHTEGNKRGPAAARRRKGLILRRIGAGLLVAAAMALAVFLRGIDLGAGKLMWGVACALLLIEALLLAVDLKVSRVLQGVLGVLCIALLGLGFLTQYFVRVDGEFVPKYLKVTRVKVTDDYPEHFTEMESLRMLDMRDSTVEDFEPIRSLRALENVDVRGNYAFDQYEHDALAAALPNCAIRWSIPVKGAHFDSEAEEMDLRELPLSIEELKALFARYPDKRFAYRVPLLGGRYALDTESLDLRNCEVDTEAIEEALMMLPVVNDVDLRGVPAGAEAVAYLCDTFPDVSFKFTFDVPGQPMETDDERVQVSGDSEDLLAYVSFIDYMPNLEQLDASDIELTSDQADEVQLHKNGGKVKHSLTVFGRKVSTEITELNLDGVPVPDVETMEKCIAHLPNLKKVSLLDAGLSQDECGQLFDAHPDIKFVFWIEFGHYKLRTDVTAFSTQLGDGNRYGFNDKTFEPIRYCTDLMMLDLGHNHITNLENFKDLTKLRVLILADNEIKNIDPVANFKDLEYFEFFLNDVSDLTPLTGLDKLVDLNMFYNPIGTNYQALKSMKQLKRLWIGHCRLSSAMLKDLAAALPDTRINTKGKGSTMHGWRQHSHYDTLKQMYAEERYIPFEDSPPVQEAQEQGEQAEQEQAEQGEQVG